MTEVAKALKAFYSGFGIPAYTEDSVPDKEELPYITYTAVESGVFSSATHQARVWYPGTGYAAVNAKADEITKAIGPGKKLKAGKGFLFLFPGTPLCQMQPADDKTRIVYINLEIRCYV